MPRFSFLKGAAIILALWTLLSVILAAPIVPCPHVVLASLIREIARGTIFLHLGASLFRILCSIVFTVILALPAGILAARRRGMERLVSPLLYMLYPVPKIAFLPVLMVLFGLGDLPKILLVGAILFFPLTIAVRDGTANLDKGYFQLARSLNLTGRQVMHAIILPGILPEIISALRVSIGISLSVLFFAENFATTWGIGYYIMNGWIMADYLRMYTGIVTLSLSGIGLYAVIDAAGKRLVPWKRG